MENKVSKPEFWNECYLNNNTGWDLGGVTPVFKNWCDNLQKKHSIFVPGAGNGYDAIYFASQGHSVTAVDFSENAVERMKNECKLLDVKLNIINEDLFNLNISTEEKFDYIIEYTCFCAIDIRNRLKYIDVANNLLKKNGELIGLFLPLLKENSKEGPPFKVSLNEVIKQFSNKFRLIDSKKHPLSIDSRKENEQYLHFKKIN